MLKQKVNLKKFNFRKLSKVSLLFILITSFSLSPLVRADEFDTKIKALQKQNAANQKEAAAIQVVINSYQDKIDALQSSISSLEAKINSNLKKRNSLNAQIAVAQKQLVEQKAILSDNLRSFYLDSQTTTLEILASSQNISEYLDLQQYRTAIQDKIKSTVDQINALKAQLTKNKVAVERLIADDKKIQNELTSQQNEVYGLQNMSQAEKDAYDSKIRSNNASIARLRAQQAAALAALVGSNGSSTSNSPVVFKNAVFYNWNYCGDYRYCGYGLDSYVNDDWGLRLARECVHYVADSLDRRGYYIPYGLFAGRGNANQWVYTTTSTGSARIVSDPAVNDVVYIPSGGPVGPLGHVQIVDKVYGNGWIKISQMNWYPGIYSEMDMKVTPNLVFLRFNK